MCISIPNWYNSKLYIVLAIVPLLFLATRRKKVNILDVVDDLTQHATLRYNQRDLEEIEQIVVHHSAQTNGDPFVYAAYHVKTHGWPGIGYHYVIQKDGLIFQTQQLETVSYHARNCNQNSVGICLTGNYNVEQVPAEQLQALYGLIDEIQRILRKKLIILPHHDCTNTDCPGKNMPIDQISKKGIGAVRTYKISKGTHQAASKLGVTVKPSTRKNKKIDVFKNNELVASVGHRDYDDYYTYLRKEREGIVDKGTAAARRKQFRLRFASCDTNNCYYAKKLLW